MLVWSGSCSRDIFFGRKERERFIFLLFRSGSRGTALPPNGGGGGWRRKSLPPSMTPCIWHWDLFPEWVPSGVIFITSEQKEASRFTLHRRCACIAPA